ncbi:MAG TPA: wax ester/triacylglycerol synthase family O-acyltransferase [Solirubrobacterales bacterium]|nr:wax ester/triacylglycerol synthase family O-acyltransferase [Solirubrobacterales bacterium]
MLRQLTSLDAQFLAIESDTHYGHVGGLVVLDPSTRDSGELRLEDAYELLEQRMHLLPVMRWKLAEVPLGLDRPYWVEDPDFDLEYHLREIALPDPGDDRRLAEQVCRIASRHLDRSRPLWELYLIQGLEGGRCGILTKMHHAMIDGMSGAEIMGVLFDLEPEGREIPPPDPDAVEGSTDEPSGVEMLGRGLFGLPLQPLRSIAKIPSTLPYLDVAPSILGAPGAETISRYASRVRNLLGAGEGDGEIIERPRHRAPHTPFSGRISAHRRFSFGSLPLATVKDVKNRLGVKVNDVVVGLCAGAVREWLIANDALPNDPLLAQIPVSVRTEEQVGTYGNRVSVMIVPIPTDEPDPVQRVLMARDAMSAAKDRHKAMPAELLQDVANFIPPAINARAARVALQLGTQQRMRPLYNLVISNVPGPPFPLYLGGAEVKANYPVSVIADGSGLNITVMSYRGSMDFGLIADRDQIPEVWDLIGALERDLEAIEAAAD